MALSLPELNKIHVGDCLEIMKTWPDKCVDMIITDPPYGINIAPEGTVGPPPGKFESHKGLWPLKQYAIADWDKQRPPVEIFQEMHRISKDQIIFGGNYFSDFLPPNKCWLIWDKGIPEGFTKAHAELAWTSLSTYTRVYNVSWNGMIRHRGEYDEDRYHPTQKPVTLIRQILADHASPEAIICDPFVGSGSILVAAQNLGHSWIGIEINPEYVKIAEERLARETAQLKMF